MAEATEDAMAAKRQKVENTKAGDPEGGRPCIEACGLEHTAYTKEVVASLLGGEDQFAVAVMEGSIYTIEVDGVELWVFV